MRKRCTPIVTLLLLWSVFQNVNAQIYQVRLTTFTEAIEPSYFTFAGYDQVSVEADPNNFARYTLGEYLSLDTAKKVQQTAIKRGFANAHIHTLDQTLLVSKENLQQIPSAKNANKDVLFIKAVQFSTADKSLDKAILASLEQTLEVMQQHPKLKLRIVCYKDSRNTTTKNTRLSIERSRVIQNFLLANGIPAYRLKMKISDGPSPDIHTKNKKLSKSNDYNSSIILALVDLKNEIVTDTFEAVVTNPNESYIPSLTK